MRREMQSDIFDYGIFLSDIANDGIPVKKELSIQADYDFECESIQAAVIVNMESPTITDTLQGEHFPNLFVMIENTGNGQKWMDKAVMVPALFGTGQLPFILPVTYIMEKNAAFRITLTNTGAFDLARVTFTFSGRKLIQ